ncbi:class I SAM-dependent methyltransferase [Roseovarius aestuarii]|nr:class I SAM-dependent methyltransferase [Roseovarius aestuarii]
MSQDQITHQTTFSEKSIFDQAGLSGIPNEELDELVDLSGGSASILRRLAIRKKFGEPNAYLRGHVTMMGRKFSVDRRCYIPDQYAEELVRRVISDAPKNAVVLEVGTGCGWISITLKLERPDLTVLASDIDPGALAVAQRNATWHGVNVPFLESYFVDDIVSVVPDLIVANIPYGGDFEYTDQEMEERPQMPSIAICDPAGVVKPLVEFYKSVAAKKWAAKIYLETGYLPAERLKPVIETCADAEHVQNGEYGYVVLT